jgi:hypothetical protein
MLIIGTLEAWHNEMILEYIFAYYYICFEHEKTEIVE